MSPAYSAPGWSVIIIGSMPHDVECAYWRWIEPFTADCGTYIYIYIYTYILYIYTHQVWVWVAYADDDSFSYTSLRVTYRVTYILTQRGSGWVIEAKCHTMQGSDATFLSTSSDCGDSFLFLYRDQQPEQSHLWCQVHCVVKFMMSNSLIGLGTCVRSSLTHSAQCLHFWATSFIAFDSKHFGTQLSMCLWPWPQPWLSHKIRMYLFYECTVTHIASVKVRLYDWHGQCLSGIGESFAGRDPQRESMIFIISTIKYGSTQSSANMAGWRDLWLMHISKRLTVHRDRDSWPSGVL